MRLTRIPKLSTAVHGDILLIPYRADLFRCPRTLSPQTSRPYHCSHLTQQAHLDFKDLSSRFFDHIACCLDAVVVGAGCSVWRRLDHLTWLSRLLDNVPAAELAERMLEWPQVQDLAISCYH